MTPIQHMNNICP